MSKITERALKASCSSEYDGLQQVILCKPHYMKIREVINETQKYFFDDNINTEVANAQHENLIKTLKAHDIEVALLPTQQRFSEQVFTRDIGFTIGETVFIAKLESKVRQGEEQVLKEWLSEHQIRYCDLINNNIEGGDVIVDQQKVWVGVSNRTSEKAIHQLQTLLPDFQVTPIPIDGNYLHLDCVFNVLSPNEALIFPPALRKEELALLSSYYNLIEVTEEEQFTLGTNVFSIGNKTVISLPINKKVNEQLYKHGYNVIEVDISEIIKSGGAFRCITLPISRQNQPSI